MMPSALAHKKLPGILLFLLALYVALLLVVPPDSMGVNHFNLGKRIGHYGIISLGVAFVIIAGGIDLSIGSVVALSATVTAMLLMETEYGASPLLTLPLVLLMGAGIGLINGLFITKLKLPSFVVTLCGLFIFRGVARALAGDKSKGLGDRFGELRSFLYSSGNEYGIPNFLVIFLILAAVAAVFLHASVYGRYLFALGRNEQAARYAGIDTDRYRVLSYVLCSLLAAFFGILYLMEHNSVSPSSAGNFLELYAIAGAVLGGCSLRGGEGTVFGVLVGTAILSILPNLTNMWEIRSEYVEIVIGGALLFGAVVDELLRPRGTER